MGERIGILVREGQGVEEEQLAECELVEAGLALTRWPLGVFDNWSVTHIASGYAVAKKGGSREEAIVVLRELAPLTDWSRPVAEMRDVLRSLGDEIKRVVEKHGFAFTTGHPGKHSVKCEKVS